LPAAGLERFLLSRREHTGKVIDIGRRPERAEQAIGGDAFLRPGGSEAETQSSENRNSSAQKA
jgi:hypothetical protein